MINKFKNVLKGNKKSKDEIIQDDIEVIEELEVEDESDAQEVASEDEHSSDDKEELDVRDYSEFEFEKEEYEEVIEEEITTMQNSYKVERVVGKSISEAGIPIEEYKVHKLVTSTLKQFAPIIIKKGIRIEIDGLDKKIETNEEVMLFIFQEIMSNAVNSLVEGSIKIYIKDDNYLVFEDTGYGIPYDEVPKIFEEGFMASNAAPSDEVEGMGMFKCSIALEKMNYGYEIISEQGKGTSFIIDLSK